ncbi:MULTISPECIES: hypothetical protein [unclassified Leptolyngbya]|uniref:hypothetical protein n=1 Tax=unclassified Leptolyngbya TaxID=2650499 RepID=UPI001688ABCB|nr:MULTISPECIES: hypothetical protein [unclassified Leptolyngbya]MBD1912357.1 hypothetical protein [Leptolyngbya sp. FACHB-8]MBD2158007.1 hypothetical protein [Leptolyngbya sp. FACHB-16]
MLNRIKVIKELLLNKLDEILRRLEQLEGLSKTTQDIAVLTRRLDNFAEAQLENETALLEASIRILQILEARPTRSFLLLGNAQETAAAQQTLGIPSSNLQAMGWNWHDDLELSVISDKTQIILCKLPTEPHHWESLQKLQQKVPGSLGIFSLM